ncbi:hypothetical protein L2E82_32588 [Cichorium intybus]|uniref:Uncharacterized protein n=1 Tax=Cichorium intybus TaxID=13427 RepID=A0ACB9BHM6_CICIN|nr:hypothetical protein L2E82_32588 [Cichorium intybus]
MPEVYFVSGRLLLDTNASNAQSCRYTHIITYVYCNTYYIHTSSLEWNNSQKDDCLVEQFPLLSHLGLS